MNSSSPLSLLIALIFSSIIFSSCKKDGSDGKSPDQESNTCGSTTTVTDIDGNTYLVVSIGSKCWMAENLRVTKFNNGDTIYDRSGTQDWYSLYYPAWCYLNRDPNTDSKYGKMYNGHTIIHASDSALNICPQGWRLPTWIELQDLINNDLKGSNNIEKSKSVRSTTDWLSTQGTNTTGLNIFPGGYRDFGSTSSFEYVGEVTHFYTSYVTKISGTQITTLYISDDDITLSNLYSNSGAYCRCILDK